MLATSMCVQRQGNKNKINHWLLVSVATEAAKFENMFVVRPYTDDPNGYTAWVIDMKPWLPM